MWRPGNYPCQTTLKCYDVLESNIVKRGIAIVKSTANKCSCNSFSVRKRHAGEGHECDKSSKTRLGNILSKIIFFYQK